MAKPKSRRGRKIFVLTLIILVLAGLTTVALMRKRETVITVQKEKIVRRDLKERVAANGRIQPVLQVKISAEVSGEIIELPVKEGQAIKKGDLLVRIKPDVYAAQLRSAEASYQSSVSGKTLSEANLRKAEAEFKRNEELFKARLIAESVYVEYRTSLDVAQAQVDASGHQVDVAKASLARTEEELAKTTIYSPLTGTVSKLNSELGERVVGTAMMSGTEIMIVADLNLMEARVDIGEIDIPLIGLNQLAELEVDAFRDRKFKGVVSEIANSSKGAGLTSGGGGTSQEGTKFEVRIRIQDLEKFRPGMTVTAEIETRYRSNVLCVPIQSVTTRPPKKPDAKSGSGTNTLAGTAAGSNGTSLAATSTNTASTSTNASPDGTNTATSGSTTNAESSETGRSKKKEDDKPRHVEVVFLAEGEHAKMVSVKRGISDDTYTEITEGLTEGQEVISGGYKAISKDLDDGKKIRIGSPEMDKEKDKDKAAK